MDNWVLAGLLVIAIGYVGIIIGLCLQLIGKFIIARVNIEEKGGKNNGKGTQRRKDRDIGT